MNTKQRVFVSALADGASVEMAASKAGYNMGYARKKAREPAVQTVVERLTMARLAPRPVGALGPDSAQAESGQIPGVLWEIIRSPESDEQARIAAARALITYDRYQPKDTPKGDIIIIDDVAVKKRCRHCPYYNTVRKARERMGRKMDG